MIDTCRGCGEWRNLSTCAECPKSGLCEDCQTYHRQRCHSKGVHADRIEHPASYREKAFVQQWEHENQNTDMVLLLMNRPRGLPGFSRGPHDNEPLEQPSERDRIVAVTIVQWLGSNVGWSFIEEAMRRSGFRITRDSIDHPGAASEREE